MCGIIAAFNTTIKKSEQHKGIKATPVNEFIIRQYEEQFDRGQRGFGIIRINDKKKFQVDRACEPTKFLIDLYLKQSSMIIAHHRTPTSTDNTIDQTHPIFVSNPILDHDYLVVHNGIITNDDELRLKHIELGFKYTTEYTETYSSNYAGYIPPSTIKFNDSEALAIELALFIEEKLSAVGTNNAAAFIVLQINRTTQKATRVYFGRNSVTSCLNMFKSYGKLKLSSEGIGDEVIANQLYSFDINDPTMRLEGQALPFQAAIKPVTTPTPTTAVATTTTQVQNNVSTNTPATTRQPRSWNIGKEDAIAAPDDFIPFYAEKTYLSDLAVDFKTRTRTDDTNALSHTLDDVLDEQFENLTELIGNYKDTLLQDKLEHGEIECWIDQVRQIFKGMKIITDIADKSFVEKRDIELSEEVADYNSGYFGSKTDTQPRLIGFAGDSLEMDERD